MALCNVAILTVVALGSAWALRSPGGVSKSRGFSTSPGRRGRRVFLGGCRRSRDLPAEGTGEAGAGMGGGNETIVCGAGKRSY